MNDPLLILVSGAGYLLISGLLCLIHPALAIMLCAGIVLYMLGAIYLGSRRQRRNK